MSTSLYNYRPLVCRQMEPSTLMSSSFHEQTDRFIDPIIRPLPSSSSSSSMSTWTQSVRRLNTEYTSTINALQQAKETIKQMYPETTDTVSQYANFVARGIDNLSNNETKKSLGVTFCLTTPISQESLSSSPSLSKTSHTPPSSTVFSKPKLVRPLELDTFIPSIPPLPKLEPVSITIEKNDKVDSIANIIKKFNNFQHSSPTEREVSSKTTIYDSIQTKKDQINSSPFLSTLDINPTNTNKNSTSRVRFESSIKTYELEEIPYESPPPPLSSSSSSSLASEDSTSSTTSISDDNLINKTNQFDINNNNTQEETTYTVETFYKTTNNNISNSSSINQQQLVIIRENTTEEQFNLAKEKNPESQEKNHSLQDKFIINEKKISPLTTPLLTYLHVPVNQTTPTPPTLEKPEKIANK